jgi:hypothetical protein
MVLWLAAVALATAVVKANECPSAGKAFKALLLEGAGVKGIGKHTHV